VFVKLVVVHFSSSSVVVMQSSAAPPAPATSEVMFPDINSENPVTQLESLCMNCEHQGITRLLLTRIPFFRDVILSSFECPHCNWQNCEIQSAGDIEEKGCKYELKVIDPKDLNRQLVKAASASISVPELELEIPSITQRGSLNTIEGILQHTAESLEMGQAERTKDHPDAALKVAAFIDKVKEFASGKQLPFTFKLDDPAGNSFIQNPLAPADDPNMSIVHYRRTNKQDIELGIFEELSQQSKHELQNAPEEVLAIPTICSECHRPGLMKSVLTDIPHFKEALIMAFACEFCGYKSNEVRGGGEIPEKGRRLTLKVQSADDFARDVLKSETAAVEIPEIELELADGTLGGKFTTVEGLLSDIVNAFKKLPFVQGDSSDNQLQQKFATFTQRLIALLNGGGNIPFTLIINDPLGASYIQNPLAPDADPQLSTEEYVRTREQDEAFGIDVLREQTKRECDERG